MLWVLFSLVSFFALDAATQHQNMFVFGFLWPLSFSLVASVFRLCADATSICGIEFQFLWRSKRIIQFHQIDINCCGLFSFISVQAVKILLHTRQITKLLYDFITNGSGYKCSHIKISRDKNVHLCARVPIVNKRAKMKWNKFLYGAVCLGNDNNNNSSGIGQKSGKKIQQLVVVIKKTNRKNLKCSTQILWRIYRFLRPLTRSQASTRGYFDRNDLFDGSILQRVKLDTSYHLLRILGWLSNAFESTKIVNKNNRIDLEELEIRAHVMGWIILIIMPMRRRNDLRNSWNVS